MSIDKTFIVKTFNDHFFEFFEDILRILPNNMHVKTALRSFRTVCDLNKTILVKCWHKFVYLKYTNGVLIFNVLSDLKIKLLSELNDAMISDV